MLKYIKLCKIISVKTQSHMNIYVFVWLLTLNRSDAGLIEKPKLVTCKFVNFVVHDGVLEYIYIYIYIFD